MKSVLLMFSFLLISQAGLANTLTEPLLTAPFAKEIPMPKACDREIYEATVKATKSVEGYAPGGVFDAKVYEIKVRGFVYNGTGTVFEADRIIEQGGLSDIRAVVRGELSMTGKGCTTSKVRIVKTYRNQTAE